MLIDRLIDKITALKAPIVVGLDPRLEQIPKYLTEAEFAKSGKTLDAAANIFFEFNKQIIDNIYDLVPAVKPQIAMYEQYGAVGIDCYIKTVQYAREKGLIVIGDIKRGDIASTATAYSDGHIGRVDIGGERYEVFGEDFITINPYMGYDSIEPYLKDCAEYDRGLFVLVKTSNPFSGQLQDLRTDAVKPIYVHVGELVAEWGAGSIGRHGYSNICAVVGATHPAQGAELRKLLPHTFFLVPGYGQQGATATDLRGVFADGNMGAIVNSSRGITAAWQIEKYRTQFKEDDFGKAARAAVLDMKADLNS